jgi:hypothetical protein
MTQQQQETPEVVQFTHDNQAMFIGGADAVVKDSDILMVTYRATVLRKEFFNNFIAEQRKLIADNLGGELDTAPPTLTFTTPVLVRGIGRDKPLDGVIGCASLFWEDNKLIADITIPLAGDDAQLIEAGVKVFAESTFIENGGGTPVELRDLWLTTNKPQDDAETPLERIAK